MTPIHRRWGDTRNVRRLRVVGTPLADDGQAAPIPEPDLRPDPAPAHTWGVGVGGGSPALAFAPAESLLVRPRAAALADIGGTDRHEPALRPEPDPVDPEHPSYDLAGLARRAHLRPLLRPLLNPGHSLGRGG